VASRPDALPWKLTLRAGGKVGAAALLAAAGEPRITAVRADLESRCFGKGNLPVVPFVLRHGDVLQWAALLADRTLTLRGVAKEAGRIQWLRAAFRAARADGAAFSCLTGRVRDGSVWGRAARGRRHRFRTAAQRDVAAGRPPRGRALPRG